MDLHILGEGFLSTSCFQSNLEDEAAALQLCMGSLSS